MPPSRVPAAKLGISKTPMGPFQTTVLAPRIAPEKRSMVLGPMSRHSRSAGIASTPTTILSASSANLSAATQSTGRRTFFPPAARFSSRIIRASAGRA
jgi:hypothetical protein